MNYKHIANGLKSLGLKKGDIVLLHSSFLSLGKVENGPTEVIKAFLSVIGKTGTLLVPVFGKLGVIPDEVKKMPGVVISSAPVGTLAAIGPDAEELLDKHWCADTAHGINTPLMRLAEKDGVICLLGVDQDRNTTLHTVEALLELPYLGSIEQTFKAPNGKTVTKTYKYYPGPHRDFIGIDKALQEADVMRVGTIGQAQVRLINANEMIGTLLELGSTQPDLFLCDNPACADCVKQRAALKKARFADEAFKITASSKLAGRYIPEIIENLQNEGLQNVELDYVQGQVCANLPAETLAGYVNEFEQAGISVSALRCPVVPNDVDKFAEKMKSAGIKRVILPVSGADAAIKALKKANIELSVVNRCETALRASAMYKEYAAQYKSITFTFNPVNFAVAGENPFLHSYNAGRYIRKMGQLDIVDALRTGEATAFAKGNGELRELISILRCGSFFGYFCLGGGAAYPGTLKDAVKDFFEQLEKI